MTAGSDLVFDHLSHKHIEPRAEYLIFLDVLFTVNYNTIQKEMLQYAEHSTECM